MSNTTVLPTLPNGSLPAGLPGSNVASNYGSVFATAPAWWSAESPQTARTNGPLAVSVRLFDLFNQSVLFWDDVSISVYRQAPSFL